MGRGKKRVAARRGTVESRAVKTKLGKNPSKHFLPYQEQEIFEAADMVASEEHRSNLEFRIRADTGKVTNVRFHKSGSYTDMKGGVWVRDYAKEGDEGKMDPIDRVICIEGNAEHEGLHCRVTDPVIFEKFKKDARERAKKKGVKGGIEADQIWRIWNALEDGMIESYSRDNDAERYVYLYGLAKLDPVVSARELDKVAKYPAPKQGYHPTDARGKQLTLEPDGAYSAPKGTPVSVWGDTPLGLAAQMDAAILTSALPQYRPGKMRPEVKKCLNECRPYIHAAVTGNTADCCDAARNIYAILKKHDLLPDVKIVNGSSMIMLPGGMPMPGDMGMQISAPQGMQFAMSGSGGGEEGEDEGEGGEGSDQKGQSAKNPMPGVKGAPQFGEDLSDAVGGGGAGEEEGEEGDEEGEGAGAGGEDEDENADEKDGAGAGDKESDEDADEDDKGKDGKGKDGKGDSGDGADGADGQGKKGPYTKGADGKGQQGSDKGDKDGNEIYGAGGSSGAGGYNFNGDPVLDDEEAEKSLNDIREKMKNKMDDLATQATQSSAQQKRAAGTRAIRWKTPPGQTLHRKEDMDQSRSTSALDNEAGKFTYAGRTLAQKMRQIKDRFEEPQTNLLYGRLDRRRLVRAAAGNPRVMKRVKIEEAGDIAIDVVFDLSGSTNGDRADQYRAGMMFGIAGQQTSIPVSIYGGDEDHYEFKRPDEKDLKGLKALFHAGGGGTPGARWVEFQRARLSLSKADHKWAFIITDGATFDPGEFRSQVLQANKEGIQVFGLSYGCSKASMDNQFGPGNWALIEDYLQAPKIAWKLIEKTLKGRLGV
jgi:hypothetical protein